MKSLSLRCLLFPVFSFALILATTNSANACTCGPRQTVLDSFENSDEVVIVRAVSVEKAQETEERKYIEGVKSTTMVVEKVFKGKLKVKDEIVFGQGTGGNCIWTFDERSVGHQFLLYLTRPEKLSYPFVPSNEAGLWFAFSCGRSSGLSGATEDLLYLENESKLRGKTRISGRITGGYTYRALDVEGKKIKIIGPEKTYQTKIDKDGVFEIYDLPPGKYFIEPETPAGWKLDPIWFRYSASIIGAEDKQETRSPNQVAVMLEPKKHASVYLELTIDNYIRGRVVDPTGRVMDHVCVYLLRPGEDRLGPFGCTDEQGRFQITEVPPGQYVLVANHDGKPSSHEPFPKTFYPNVTERERATLINIGPGENVANVDILIPKLVETVTISGVLRYSDGKPAVDNRVKFRVTVTNEKVIGNVNGQTDKAGRFTLKVLKGLTGELAAEHWLAKGLFKNCPKVDELIAKSGNDYATAQSNVIKLTTEQDVYEVELTFPFPQCEKARE